MRISILFMVALLLPSLTAWPQEPPATGSISGTVIDQSGASIAGARLTLAGEDKAQAQEVRSGGDGHFSFASVAAGPFALTINATGFAAQVQSGTVRSGEAYVLPEISLTIAPASTDVQVAVTRKELAQDEVTAEEKQRILGFIPNFNVAYPPNSLPLSAKQKFGLAWKTSVDPFSFALVAAIAGVQQSQNELRGYGQGAQGYGKRYGAAYANFFASSMIGGAILPSIWKQDPRYLYKGTGSLRSRVAYALAMSVVCKGDNGHWQPNYSSIIGGLAAGGISNLYYPDKNRTGGKLVIEDGFIGIAANAGSNLVQEFLLRKLTPSQRGKRAVKN